MTDISRLTSDILSKKKVKNILITQAKPENEKSPYFELAKKHQVNLEFESFISVVSIPSKEFRKQKIDIASFSAVIFTSRNAIENFFRTCEEMRLTISPETKYFCISESIALYLQKFILYRKRKVFYGDDGTNASLFAEISKFKDQEKFLYPCSESFDSEITNWLIANHCTYAIPVLYEIISNDIKEIVNKHNYEIICFFSPLGVRSLKENFPKFSQNGTLIGAFGDNTRKAVLAAGLNPDIIAPLPKAPSMIAALDQYLSALSKAK